MIREANRSNWSLFVIQTTLSDCFTVISGLWLWLREFCSPYEFTVAAVYDLRRCLVSRSPAVIDRVDLVRTHGKRYLPNDFSFPLLVLSEDRLAARPFTGKKQDFGDEQ